jgi:hypothetical protein
MFQHRLLSRARRAAISSTSLLLALTLCLPARAADITYKIQQLAKLGDTVAGQRLTVGFSPSALNDRGQLAFVAPVASGGQALFLVSDGQITPLVIGGGDGPDGPWPKTLTLAFGPPARAVTTVSVDGHSAPVTFAVGETVTIRFGVAQAAGQVQHWWTRDMTGSGKYDPSYPIFRTNPLSDGTGLRAKSCG